MLPSGLSRFPAMPRRTSGSPRCRRAIPPLPLSRTSPLVEDPGNVGAALCAVSCWKMLHRAGNANEGPVCGASAMPTTPGGIETSAPEISRETKDLAHQNGIPPRHPRGRQRDKIYREALRLELADMSEGVHLKKLREIARAHIEKAAAGDMQAIKELADRLDGKPAQFLEHSGPDSEPKITRIVREIVHTRPSPEELYSEDGIFECNGNGSGGPDSCN